MIDKTAVIEEGAILGADVKIGPYCTVGKDVKLGDRVELISHVVVGGKTEIGDDTIIYPFAAIGLKCQDLKFQDDEEMTGLVIGQRCRIREYVTIQSGTPAVRGTKAGIFGRETHTGQSGIPPSQGTKIGNDCQIMVSAHVAHDCHLGNNIILSNLVQLAGHVEIDDFATISPMSAVHQFCSIGAYAFLGAISATASDIPPYVIYEGLPAKYRTINRLKLVRNGFTDEDMHAIRAVYTAVFGTDSNDPVSDKLAKVRKEVSGNKYAMNAIDFIENRATRGLFHGEKKAYQRNADE